MITSFIFVGITIAIYLIISVLFFINNWKKISLLVSFICLIILMSFYDFYNSQPTILEVLNFLVIFISGSAIIILTIFLRIAYKLNGISKCTTKLIRMQALENLKK